MKINDFDMLVAELKNAATNSDSVSFAHICWANEIDFPDAMEGQLNNGSKKFWLDACRAYYNGLGQYRYNYKK